MLESLIVFWGERSGKVVRERREILAENQSGLHRMTQRSQFHEQATEGE